MESTLRILMIDDNPDDCLLIIKVLEQELGNLQIEQVTGKDKYYQALERGGFDLVITDYMLGWINGLAILREVRARYPDCPVIMATATGSEEIAVEAMKAGLNDYVLKTPKHLVRIPAAVRSVMEQCRRVKALREAESRYKQLFERVPVGLYQSTTQGRITEANRAMAVMLGYADRESLFSVNMGDLYVNPDEYKRCLEKLESTGRECTCEIGLRRLDGRITWCLHSIRLLYSEDGGTLCCEGSLTDITARKEAEDIQARLATAIEQAAESIVITDPRGVIQYVNPIFEQTTGFSREEAIGQTPGILKSGRQDEAFYTGLWESISRGEVWKGHFVNRRKDGSLFEEESTISPVRDRTGNIINFVAVKRDVTQEVKLERQLNQAQKMEALGTLSGGIAHDFNNILGIIFGYSEMALLDIEQGSQVRDNLQQVLKAANRARDLVQQILAFSRQSEQERKPLQIGLVVKEALKMLRSSLPSTIEIKEEVKSKGAIHADPTQVHQILMNLCTNAGHAMREKGGTLYVSLDDLVLDDLMSAQYPGLNPGPYLRLSVSDTGHGMDQSIMDRIFEPFFTTKGPGEGTGMGLAVVHGIVRSYGGTITVYSEPGNGTTFHIYLPRIETGLSQESVVEKPLPRGSERILFVDDEPALALLGKRMLERLGYRVVSKTSSDEALETFRTQPDQFDLVISDMTMPHMTGIELARELLRLRGDIPIVICTGFSHVTLLETARQMGIREFVMKPIVVRQIAEMIRRVLDMDKHG